MKLVNKLKKQKSIRNDSFQKFDSIQAQSETQKAAQEYQRSVEVYRVAKETLSLAESKLLKADKREFDAAWQEYVNHATMKVTNFLT